MQNIFYILNGNNGATYIINTSSFKSISESLKFYKARTLKQKIQKNVFGLYLMCINIINLTSRLKSLEYISLYLGRLSDLDIDFELDNNSSILVSPTRDKIIIHHHGEFFQKFAFAKSLENVKNEANIYKLLDVKLSHFEVSSFFDKVQTSKHCSFKLSCKRNYIPEKLDLVSALVEFFLVSLQKDFSLLKYMDVLQSNIVEYDIESKYINTLLEQYKLKHKEACILLGLVHRDFKPWNINDTKGLLIFDFEEAVVDGLPLEDLFNYGIDPMIRYKDTQSVYENIFKKESVDEYERYLKILDIKVDFLVFLNLYIIERIIFWKKAGDNSTSNSYVMLFEYINERELEYEK